MPSQSKSQQRLMGVAYAVKSGDMQLSDVDGSYREKVKELVDGMSLQDLKDFASTPHEDLPETVEENITPANIGGMGPVLLPTETELGSGDVPSGKKKKLYNRKMKKAIPTFENFIRPSKIEEAKRSTVHKAAKEGSYPAVIVVIQDGKVIHQEKVVSAEHAPAVFNVTQEKYPKATLHLEDKTGKRLFSEARDFNDPILMKLRAAQMKRDAKKNEPAKKEINPDYKALKNATKIKALKKERVDIMRDMEQEAEPEGGKIADRYGKLLNKIDNDIIKLGGNPMSEKESVEEAKMPEPRKDEYYFSVRNSDAKDVWKMADDEFGNDIGRGRIEVLFQKNKYVIKDFELAKRFYQYMRDRGVKFFDQNFVSESIEVNEAKFKAGQVWVWKHVDGDKNVEITDIKSNGDVVGKITGTSDEFIVRDANKWLKKQVKESVEVNEARSINKIQKEYSTVTSEMAEVVLNWKAAKEAGDAKAEANFLQRLKDLTAQKKGLEKELDQAVMGKDRNVELAGALESLMLEGSMSEIDIIAQEAKNLKDFIKEVMKYLKVEDSKELRDWLVSIYSPYQN